MTETADKPAQAHSMAEDLLKHVDIERLGGYASAAAAGLALVRRHPWLLVAAGTTAAVIGAWQIARKNDDEPKGKRTKYLKSENGHRD